MKKFFVFLPIFVASFFLLLPNVKADTINLNLNEADFNYINDDFFRIRKLSLDYVNENGGYYYIFYQSNLYRVIFFNSNNFHASYNTSGFKISGHFNLSRFDLVNDNLVSSGGYNAITRTLSISNNTISYIEFLDSNFVVKDPTSCLSFDISFSGYNYPFTSCESIPSLYDMYQVINSTPPDNTPLLTNFIDISIKKLAVICNFITSSYIYLTPFVILIFYFVILLFRRLK